MGQKSTKLTPIPTVSPPQAPFDPNIKLPSIIPDKFIPPAKKEYFAYPNQFLILDENTFYRCFASAERKMIRNGGFQSLTEISSDKRHIIFHHTQQAQRHTLRYYHDDLTIDKEVHHKFDGHKLIGHKLILLDEQKFLTRTDHEIMWCDNMGRQRLIFGSQFQYYFKIADNKDIIVACDFEWVAKKKGENVGFKIRIYDAKSNYEKFKEEHHALYDNLLPQNHLFLYILPPEIMKNYEQKMGLIKHVHRTKENKFIVIINKEGLITIHRWIQNLFWECTELMQSNKIEDYPLINILLNKTTFFFEGDTQFGCAVDESYEVWRARMVSYLVDIKCLRKFSVSILGLFIDYVV